MKLYQLIDTIHLMINALFLEKLTRIGLNALPHKVMDSSLYPYQHQKLKLKYQQTGDTVEINVLQTFNLTFTIPKSCFTSAPSSGK